MLATQLTPKLVTLSYRGAQPIVERNGVRLVGLPAGPAPIALAFYERGVPLALALSGAANRPSGARMVLGCERLSADNAGSRSRLADPRRVSNARNQLAMKDALALPGAALCTLLEFARAQRERRATHHAAKSDALLKALAGAMRAWIVAVVPERLVTRRTHGVNARGVALAGTRAEGALGGRSGEQFPAMRACWHGSTIALLAVRGQ